MQRWLWITASVVALLGLQGPLCAMACLESPAAATASQAPTDAMPCHGGPATPLPASEPPAGDHDCQCGEFVAALTGVATALPAGAAAASAPATLVAAHVHGPLRPHRPAPAAERLPPPDTLLLNSTLII